ncbi:MAG: YdbH domain-containing protein [Brevundimonas sp.]|uniref:intermembrane phospholipid transport protein YdbH family protein n=1 Tax=Brevundimonas sp. TaxID=1871086 RepID=UPI00273406FE|nr:YdbH domain-containing protein [Brevundimonas sp.]MDP3379663.1 YdbH domain-containing protein [Brevundimonas sp.]
MTGIVVGLLILLAALYLNRRLVAREVLVGWLDRQGIAAEVEVERVELNGFVGRIRIGDPEDPDFLAERVEVDYGLTAPWSDAGFGARPGRIRLVAPSLRATWQDGRFSFGSLDPLIERFTGRPVQPEASSPLILVERGELRLTTAYGPVRVLADARIEDSRLVRLTARMPDSSLALDEQSVRGLTADLDLTTQGDRTTLRLTAAADSVASADSTAADLTLKVVAVLPYPEGTPLRLDGPGQVKLSLDAATYTADDTEARTLSIDMSGEGALDGILTRPRFVGRSRGTATAGRLTAAGSTLTEARAVLDDSATTVDLSGEAARWSLVGPARLRAVRMDSEAFGGRDIDLATSRLVAGGRDGRFEVTGPWQVTAGTLTSGELRLAGVSGGFDLDLVSDGALTIQGQLAAEQGRWPLLGAPAADDVPELASMKGALGDFRLEAPGLIYRSGVGGGRLDLTRPVAIRPRSGGQLTIREGDAPVLVLRDGEAAGGQLRLTSTRGGGLPEAEISVPRWALIPGGFAADFDGRAVLDFGLGRGLTLAGDGRLQNRNGIVTVTTRDCLAVTAEWLELGENDVTDVKTGLCPTDRAPLVRIADGGWRVDGRLADGSGRAPFLALEVEDLGGALVVIGRPQGLSLDLTVNEARIEDATQPIRFNSLNGRGVARMRGTSWTGDFVLSRNGMEVAQLDLAHDGLTGVGGVDISTGDLTFAERGLQPSTLTPLAADLVGEPVTGEARFDGRIGWTAVDGASTGRLALRDLTFSSPAGQIMGLEGTVDFTSLAPLTTAPDQSLTARSLEVAGGVTELGVTFTLDKAALSVSGAELAVGAGRVSIEPFDIPLDPAVAWNGTVLLERVQLGDLVAGAGFGDKVQLDAVVSGRIPFVRSPDGQIRISGGSLEAVQPGRLSIQREALAGLEAGGGGEEIPPGVVEDLAYQAMEYMAFDTLTARVDSLDGGRLGVLFRIRGRHDPPERQELRLGLLDVIRRDFLGQRLELPSDTGILLTLDTTFNLDQIVSDILAYNRARRGEPDPVSASEP